MTDPAPDRAERARIAAEGRAVAAFAGATEADPWLDSLTARWVEGEVTIGEMWAAVDALYGLPHDRPDAQH